MNRVVLLSRVVALLSGVFLVVSVYLLGYTVMMHRNGLAPYVLVWICTAGLVVSEPACALFVEKSEYAQKHRWLIIGSWVYLVCGAVAAITNAAIHPSWEKQGVVPVSAAETPWLHLVIVQAPVGLVFFGLMRERIIELMKKKRAMELEVDC